jgi:UDP-2,4-diacetamido-2,4,6-trideoxy-beta-L-altropyranose hydrolase
VEKIMIKYLFYVTAGKKWGMGHLRRCLAIASQVKTGKKNVLFIIKGDPTAFDLLRKLKFNAIPYSFDSLNKIRTKYAVIDQKEDVSADINALSNNGAKICLMDNTSGARLLADAVIYPVSHLVDDLDWKGFKGRKYFGAKYFPLNKEFINAKHAIPPIFTILVIMGGADPNNVTSKVSRALKTIRLPYKALILIGPAFSKQSIAEDIRFKIVRSPKNVAALMAQADLAITAFGTSLYELASMGVPAAIIHNFSGDADDVRNFTALGTAVSIGRFNKINGTSIVKQIISLMNNHQFLLKLSRNGRKLVDGKGAQRIAKILRDL